LARRGQAALSWRAHTLVLLGYFALSAVLIGRGALGHLDSDCVCTGSADPLQFVWTMVWWPHAIGNGLNPFLTHAIWVPKPFDLASATAVPLAAIVVTPVTLTLGPLASYNLLVLLSPALAAFFSFRLCQYLTGRVAPALVGGFLFGFSSYMLGQMIGHLNLTLVFFVPLAVHIVLRRVDGVIGRRRFVISIAAVVAGQALLSTEVLFTALMFGAITLLAGWVFADADGRSRIRLTVIEAVGGGVIAAVVISPFLYYAVLYTSIPEILAASRSSMDALNPLIPTPVQRLGRTSFAPVAEKFPGGYPEAGGYLGVAIVLLAGWWLVATRDRAMSRVMIAVLVCTVVGSLGTALYIAGQPTISLPWKIATHLPLLKDIIPVRFAMYTALIVAVAVAQALSASVGSAALRWSLAVVGIVMLLPSGGSALFHSTPPDPHFFTSDQYRQYLDREEVVLAFPFSSSGPSMLWQARTDMWFRLAGGYLSQQPPPDYLEEPAVLQFYSGTADAETPCLIRSFIERRNVGAVVLESSSVEPWRPALEQLGLHRRAVGGVDLYRVPRTMKSPVGCT
jgi:hypothetical protein